MKLEIEWHVPWPLDWDPKKRSTAADRIVEYMEKGTFYETTRRMQMTEAKVMGPEYNPMIHLTLEV